jgi:adenylosuccinate lyase
MLSDWQDLCNVRQNLKAKGFKGAVGTGASFNQLVGEDQIDKFNELLSDQLDLSFFSVTTQVYPRKQDYRVLSALAGLGASLNKFAFDLRILQSPAVGELSEPFGIKQVGSSAMPFKRNPINAEKINSLARYLAQLPRIAWDNAAHSLLERTLDDSANRRIILPESFLVSDELLMTANRIADGFSVNKAAMAHNLSVFSPFAAIERLLMVLVKAGADRQKMHEHLRKHSMKAWKEIQDGNENPLVNQITHDAEIQRYVSEELIMKAMEIENHLGDAPQQAKKLAQVIKDTISETKKI